MSSQTTKPSFDSVQKQLDARIKAFVRDYDYPGDSPEARAAFNHLADYISRPSKRIRGAITILSYRMFGGEDDELILDAALAIELIQNAFLSVDDVMDRSDLRRGAPSIHKLYENELSELDSTNRTHFSNMLAINVGFITAHIAAEIMASLHPYSENVQLANTDFHRSIIKTAIGQTEDMYSSFSTPSREKILHVLQLKSSYYTFINPMNIGALLAGERGQYSRIESFGLPAGLAFQLQDDLIGMFGDSKVSGKSASGDLQEGKKTLLIDYALEKASPSEKKTILQSLGNDKLSETEADKVRRIIESTGSKKYSEKMIQQNIDEARRALEVESWDKEYTKSFSSLLDRLEARNS